MTKQNNLWLWDKFKRPAKEHLKSFTRKGGFTGTAIRPMNSIQQMTETFGPCGVGWGYTQPTFETSTEQDGQKLVYCTVGVWYVHEDKKSELIYGCGGDFVVSKTKDGLRPDDEAHKKSFTDALMNAMKHIGMGADVHMGLFDGSKYIDEKSDPKKGGRLADNADVKSDMKDLGYDEKAIYDIVMEELSLCTSLATLKVWNDKNGETNRLRGMSTEYKTDISNEYKKLKNFFMESEQ